MTDAAAPGAAGVAGRVVIVTGAGRGIGRGIALHLAANGASVVAAEYRDDRLAAVMAELGDEHVGVVCDVGDAASIRAMVDACERHFGRVDGLVNNAQTFRPVTGLAEVSEADWDVLHRTGPVGTLTAMQAVFPSMRAQHWGRIVNFASANGRRGAAGYGAYNASKEEIRALTRTAAREWGRDGIVVNCVCPASVAHRLRPDADRAAADHRLAAYAAAMDDHPMGRDGDPEADIAPVVAFLLSDATRYMTGQTLMVDGGAMLHA
jgi:NAD(P)-dependent dehydrogenase (short-subunit alcohol dehydrogenase family)